MANLSNPSFDYSLVDSDAKAKLIWYSAEIRKVGATHVQAGIEMGRLMAEARDLLGDSTSFANWVASECGHSVRSAYNYISAWTEFGDRANFAQIELSAMYALTKNPNAKKKALKLADKGVKVTHSMAKKLVAEDNSHKPRPDSISSASSRMPEPPAESGPNLMRAGLSGGHRDALEEEASGSGDVVCPTCGGSGRVPR